MTNIISHDFILSDKEKPFFLKSDVELSSFNGIMTVNLHTPVYLPVYADVGSRKCMEGVNAMLFKSDDGNVRGSVAIAESLNINVLDYKLIPSVVFSADMTMINNIWFNMITVDQYEHYISTSGELPVNLDGVKWYE